MPLYQDGFFLGVRTNNQAEYLAFLLGIFILKKWCKSEDSIKIISDSQLLVRQVNGIYKVRNLGLKPLHAVSVALVKKINASVEHVLRANNTHADKMANHGIDTKKPIPPEFFRMLREYKVVIAY